MQQGAVNAMEGFLKKERWQPVGNPKAIAGPSQQFIQLVMYKKHGAVVADTPFLRN